MKDINPKTLSDAIAKLPTYSPPDFEWAEIKQALNDKPLTDALRTLPVYSAPELKKPFHEAAIIEQEFPQNFNIPKLPLISWKWAAAVLIMSALYYAVADSLLLNQNPQIETEVVDVFETPESNTTEEFEQMMQLCEVEAWVCEKPEFQELKSDYKELENAQSELTTAMQTYGKDLNLIKQFNELERRKALVLNDLSLFI